MRHIPKYGPVPRVLITVVEDFAKGCGVHPKAYIEALDPVLLQGIDNVHKYIDGFTYDAKESIMDESGEWVHFNRDLYDCEKVSD